MERENEGMLEKATPSMVASMLWREKEQEYTDIAIAADESLLELKGLIKGLMIEHVKDEEALMDLEQYLEDYCKIHKELYFSYGVQVGAKMMKEIAFGES